MDYRDKFYSKYVSHHTRQLYGEQSLDDVRKQFPIWWTYFGRFLPEDKNSRLLDLGCGNGGLVYWLGALGYENTEGIDVSGEQIENAKRLGIKNIHQINLKDFLKDKKDIYDVIFARDLLEHFNKEEIKEEILEVVYRALKKDGVVVIQTVNAENLLWGRLRYADFTHEIAFTKESASQVLRLSGFEQIEVYPQRPVVYGAKSFIRYIAWRLLEIFFHLYLLVEIGSSSGIFTQNIIVTAKK